MNDILGVLTWILILTAIVLVCFVAQWVRRSGKKNQKLTADSVKLMIEELRRRGLPGWAIAQELYERGVPTSLTKTALEHFKYGVRWTTGLRGGVLEVSDNPIADATERQNVFATQSHPFRGVDIPPSVDRQRHD